MSSAKAAKKKKGPENRHKELLSLQRQYPGEDDIVPLDALKDFTVDDMDAAIESFSSAPQAEQLDPDTKEEIEEDKRRVANKWKLDVSGSKALLDVGYENFDERLVDPTPDHVAIYAGFDQQYRFDPSAARNQETIQQTLWSAYFDPLEEAKLTGDTDVTNVIHEDADPSNVRYKSGSIEDLAEIFSSGHITSDHYLASMTGAGYVRDKWVSQVTERQFESWLASATVFRTEDDWKAALVPAHAIQFIDTVHKRGKLQTWVFHIKKGLLLSVVVQRNDRLAHLFKLVTHYYTFSLQQAISVIEEVK